jgi:threonine/homoserine/homoserine lactone efflux protein
MLVVLRQMPAGFERMLRMAGGLLLLYLAVGALREWRKSVAGTAGPQTAPRTLLQAAGVNILNPNPYLGWSLVLGPMVLTVWRTTPADAVVLVVAFYATMVVMLAATIILFGTVRTLGATVSRALLLVSGVTLLALAAYQFWAAVA